MDEKIKSIINWANYFLGGLRDPECFFSVGDPLVTEYATSAFDESF